MAGKLRRLPFEYRAGNSILHRIPAGIKLLLLIIISVAVYFPFPGLNLPSSGLLKVLIIILRIIAIYAIASLFFAVTTMRELRLSIAKIETKINKKSSIAYFSLGISLMMGFIPRFFELWESANIAYKARSLKKGIRRLFIIIPLVTEKMMESAADTALALEARGLGVESATKYIHADEK